MEGAQFRACASHWRDDAIVAWLDQTLNEAYQNGMESRSEIISVLNRPITADSFSSSTPCPPWRRSFRG